MADSAQVELLKQGIEGWNAWREANPESLLDLSGAHLRGADLSGAFLRGANLYRANLHEAILHEANLTGADLREADLRGADLGWANLRWANLYRANLHEANLHEANLHEANLNEAILNRADLRGVDLSEADLHEAKLSEATFNIRADLSEADLSEADLHEADLHEADLHEAILNRADLSEADLHEADLRGADLRGANLSGADVSRASLNRANLTGAILHEANLTEASLMWATLVATVVEDATLSGSRVFGTSVWGIEGTPRAETDLVITGQSEPVVTVDNLEVAQFIYLLLHNKKIRDVIDTVTSKVVLILGRFTEERKAVLDALRDALRTHNLTPVLFDFDPSENQDFTDTVTLLARMARFVIADLTDPKSVQQELTLIAPEVMVAIRPIILAGQEPWSMFEDLQRRSQGLLPVHTYRDLNDLLQGLAEHVIEPAESRRKELLPS
jgi:uncharacterized protein YjbI with pentapeptide repeats